MNLITVVSNLFPRQLVCGGSDISIPALVTSLDYLLVVRGRGGSRLRTLCWTRTIYAQLLRRYPVWLCRHTLLLPRRILVARGKSGSTNSTLCVHYLGLRGRILQRDNGHVEGFVIQRVPMTQSQAFQEHDGGSQVHPRCSARTISSRCSQSFKKRCCSLNEPSMFDAARSIVSAAARMLAAACETCSAPSKVTYSAISILRWSRRVDFSPTLHTGRVKSIHDFAPVTLGDSFAGLPTSREHVWTIQTHALHTILSAGQPHAGISSFVGPT